MTKGTKFLLAIILVAVYSISLWGILSDSPIGAKYMFAALGLIAIAVTLYLLWPSKKTSPKPQKVPVPSVVASIPSYTKTRESYQFKVAGVTFKNGNKSRQTILRAIYFGDEPYDDELVLYHLKKYDFEGETAVAVYAKDEQIGNVPRVELPFVLEHFDDIIDVDVDVYGGGTNENGEKLSYGAKATIIYKI